MYKWDFKKIHCFDYDVTQRNSMKTVSIRVHHKETNRLWKYRSMHSQPLHLREMMSSTLWSLLPLTEVVPVTTGDKAKFYKGIIILIYQLRSYLDKK